MESKLIKLTKAESRLVPAGKGGPEEREDGEVMVESYRASVLFCEINRFWRSKVRIVPIANNAVLYA